MPQRRAGHDRQDHSRHRAGGERVDRRHAGDFGVEHARAEQEKANRDSKITDVEHEHERIADRSPSAPAHQADELEQSGGEQHHAGRVGAERQQPGHKRGGFATIGFSREARYSCRSGENACGN